MAQKQNEKSQALNKPQLHVEFSNIKRASDTFSFNSCPANESLSV